MVAKIFASVFICCAFFAGCQAASTDEPSRNLQASLTVSQTTDLCDARELLLHVPSPAWEDQIIYFIFTDRFADGDPSNNDLGHG